MVKQIRNKTLWVTGASSGIGRALSLRLARHDNIVIASGRRYEALAELQKLCPERIRVLDCDVADDDAMAAVPERLEALTGHLDMVVACAGTCEYDDDLQLDGLSYRRVFDANFFGVVNTLRSALPLLGASPAPVFAALGSLSSVVPFPRAEAYGSSKAALDYFLGAVRADLCRTALKVVLIRPGFVRTPLTARNDFAMPFLMSAEQAAERIELGLCKGRNTIDFPRRLSWPLRFLGSCKALWFHLCVPKLTRIRTLRKH
ncbi:SDR family NAD(P)-dependent oxidoreductase [Microbulbifer spongiae]|uniref:SDR family NAD(P)-dependent oxidoreductase n=1 Tax=Microbulbifer spongiae TaxID=2944933 RepID=A0ABY9E7F5_9GAMM|nr:SDR family NAD(P)-dependent oxidoreductase [Microbulbifer sp. MI-G]WKD48597.1 SDR family NAD(P)-dependent oxidoreductase [Microbulbifer sp. MI-G]